MKEKKQQTKKQMKRMLERILTNAISMSAKESGGKIIYTDTIDSGYSFTLR